MRSSGDWVTRVTLATRMPPSPACGTHLGALHTRRSWRCTSGLDGSGSGPLAHALNLLAEGI